MGEAIGLGGKETTEMLSQVLSGLSLVRHAVALTLVMGAAGATVAGAVDLSPSTTTRTTTPLVASGTTQQTTQTNTNDLEAAVNACLETKDPSSDACANAVTLSGLAPDVFWAKVALSLKAQLVEAKSEKHDKTEPTPASTTKPNVPDTHALFGLVTACVATHERTSEPCQKALELSGLSADDFWAKVSALATKPAETPKTETPKTEGLSALIGACLAKFEAARNGTYSEPIVDTEACRKAFEATGLTPEQFYAKFVAPKNATETPRPTKPTEKPRTEPKASTKPQTVSDADLLVMVRDCFTKYNAATAAKGNEDLGRAAYDACTKAIAASGLTADAFWAKFGTPQAPKI